MRAHLVELTSYHVYLDDEDVSLYCEAADEEWGVVILFETASPNRPTSRVADWERKELKRYAKVGTVKIVPRAEGTENA